MQVFSTEGQVVRTSAPVQPMEVKAVASIPTNSPRQLTAPSPLRLTLGAEGASQGVPEAEFCG